MANDNSIFVDISLQSALQILISHDYILIICYSRHCHGISKDSIANNERRTIAKYQREKLELESGMTEIVI